MNLYDSINIEDFRILLTDDDSFMNYCPSCGRETTFKRSEWYDGRRMNIKLVNSSYTPGSGKSDNSKRVLQAMFKYDEKPNGKVVLARAGVPYVDNNGAIFIKEYECCINGNHRKYEIFYKDNEAKKIIKIAQYPSEYDMGSKEYLDKLKAVCGTKEAREMVKFINKALIMESNGLGIPALVYMRRAFERLIAISEDKNKLENTGTTMAERIKNNPLLPTQIKENTRLYNIISEGIHNETEEECMELFKLIKVGFTILLRKTYEHVQEQKELEELSKLVSSK